jgi:hypothetical protein
MQNVPLNLNPGQDPVFMAAEGRERNCREKLSRKKREFTFFSFPSAWTDEFPPVRLYALIYESLMIIFLFSGLSPKDILFTTIQSHHQISTDSFQWTHFNLSDQTTIIVVYYEDLER